VLIVEHVWNMGLIQKLFDFSVFRVLKRQTLLLLQKTQIELICFQNVHNCTLNKSINLFLIFVGYGRFEKKWIFHFFKSRSKSLNSSIPSVSEVFFARNIQRMLFSVNPKKKSDVSTFFLKKLKKSKK
jgi:hypothetical protein